MFWQDKNNNVGKSGKFLVLVRDAADRSDSLGLDFRKISKHTATVGAIICDFCFYEYDEFEYDKWRILRDFRHS